MNIFTQKLIEKQSKVGGREYLSVNRASQSLLNSVKSRAPSNEQLAFAPGKPEGPLGEEDDMSLTECSPGTFVELRRNEGLAHGVVLGDTFIETSKFIVTLVASGEVWTHNEGDIMFSIPAFTSAQQAIRCGYDKIATSQHEINARVEVLKRLRALENAVEQEQTLLTSKRMNLYAATRHGDPKKWGRATLGEMTRLLNKTPSITTVFAAHKYIMDQPKYFVAREPYTSTQTFNVRPQEDVACIEAINNWKRIPNGPLHQFAEKARAVIKQSKQDYAESFSEPPSQQPAEQIWNNSDKVILSFLLRSLRPFRSTQSDPYSLGQSAIMKLLDPHGPPIADYLVYRMLVDLRVIAPWQDIVSLNPALDLDQEPEATSPRVKEKNAIVKRSFASKPLPDSPLGPEDFYAADPLHSVRHDFGNLPVYVIDDLKAEELDDGISVETCPGEDATWVHTHVADPASIIPPSHILAKEAMARGSTTYQCHRSWPLFPRTLTQRGMSLGSRSGSGSPDRTLTFSAKVDSRGNIMDYKVRAGLVRNVHVLNYNAVDEAMGFDRAVRSYPFGGVTKPAETKIELTPNQKNDLRLLLRVAKSSVDKRQRDGVVMYILPNAQIEHFKLPPGLNSPTLENSHFRGFPSFNVSVSSIDGIDRGSRSIVAEMMKFACRIASQFCTDKGLPALRRTGEPMMVSSEAAMERILSLRTPRNYVPLESVLPDLLLVPKAGYSLTPKRHFSLGLPEGEGYVRVTSPLRRFSDLMVHWQIHHALIGSKAKPPFDEAALVNYLAANVSQEKVQAYADRVHVLFWQMMKLKRWMEERERTGPVENDPLENLQGFSTNVPFKNKSEHVLQGDVIIPSLALKGTVRNAEVWPLSTRLSLKIKDIQLGVNLKVILEAKGVV
ncbi:hypothetical protein K443DRAFT_81063 [Laccaria amethystina LaAM-08-1]|uniref:RNB domain-containing protein n=1 Tax=Laccaria amethystina LaAM-08-1 TaxID=1095629 RepID=A0A0C9XCR1_9AGAR|nr:hypothetical protein K443DRAFT_81063 [Laccaria amethystina LaAM-08-1]